MFNNKKIIYLTSNWSGLNDIVFQDQEPKGMPAFILPLIRLIEQGAEVTIILITNKTPAKRTLTNSFFGKTKIIIIPWRVSRKFSFITDAIKLFEQLFALVRKNNCDFLYAHGSKSIFGVIISNIKNIPCGVRLYGTNKYLSELKTKGLLKFALSSPFLFLIFKLRNNFILITNDGSNGKRLHQKIGNPKNKLLFWNNGYIRYKKNQKIISTPRKYLLYPGRICTKKQQILALNLLSIVRKKANLQLIFVGHITEPNYFDELIKRAKYLKLENNINYLGSLSKSDLHSYMKSSLAVISFQKNSNLGNCLLEALACESVVVTYKEPEINKFLKDMQSSILVEDINEAAKKITLIFNNNELKRKIAKNGKKALETNFDTWETRIQKELITISNCLTK